MGGSKRACESREVLRRGRNGELISLVCLYRIRINCCGILDVVAYDGGQNLIHHQVRRRFSSFPAFLRPTHSLSPPLLPTPLPTSQQEDLQSLGKLILALTNLSLSAIQNLPKALEILSRSYSLEIKNLVLFLLSKPGPKGIDEVLSMLGARVLNELDASMK